MEVFLQFKELVSSKTAKDSSVVFLGNLASSILGIVFAIFAARLLGPTDWGIIAAVGNMIPILIAVADFGLGPAMFQYTTGKWQTDKEVEAKRFYLSVFTFRVITIFALGFLLFLWAGNFAQVVYGQGNELLSLFTIIGFFLVSLLDFQIFAIEARQKWKVAAIFIALTNIFRVAGLLYLFVTNQINLVSVLLVFASTAFLPFVFTFLFLPVGVSFAWSQIFTRFASFSAWMGTNKLVSAISSRLDILLLIQMLGAYEAGIYGAASRLAMGVPLIIGSFATVIAARFAADNQKESRKFFYKTIGLSAVIALGLIAGVFAAPFVTVFFGSEYSQSTQILQWLFVAMIPFVLSTSPVNLLIYHFKKPRVITVLSVFQLFVIIGINFYFIPKLGVFAPVLAIGISNTIIMVVTYLFAFKYLK